MKTRIFTTAILLFGFTSFSYSQDIFSAESNSMKLKYDFLNDRFFKDTIENKFRKSKVQRANIGGVFISPMLGVSFPLGQFGTYSNSGIQYGAKLELAYSRFYPFIFGFLYESQNNPGNAEFTTVNFLTQFDTKITSVGGSLDIILNKFLRSNFTTPIFSLEVKYATVSRVISPETSLPEIIRDESLLTYTAGLGFTIYVLDLGAKYTFAKDYTNLSFQARFHFPIVKF